MRQPGEDKQMGEGLKGVIRLGALALLACVVWVLATGTLAGAAQVQPVQAAGNPGNVTHDVATSGAGPVVATPGMVSYADLVEKLSPAVVNISTKTKPKKITPDQLKNPFEGTPFEEFFNQFQQQNGQMYGGNLMSPAQQSLGSGVVISADGYLVTNNHVISGGSNDDDSTVADEIVVKFNKDRHEFPAKLIGRDQKNDLALLKITATGQLPYAQLGDSARLRVGDPVLAIGNPFGLGGTVTSGIVSALGRNLGQGPYDDFIQTDAAINPGNSGGPLFNTIGQVVGINSAIYTRDGGSNGIGFAVPANTIKMVVAQLKQYGRPIRGYLGVKVQLVTPELAQTLGLKDDVGALVSEVVPGSPSAKAGVIVGDVIMRYNGHAINEMSDLPRLVAETAIGQQGKIDLLRDGKPLTVTTTVVEMTDDAVKPSHLDADKDDHDSGSRSGLSVQTLDAALRGQLEIPVTINGVAVVAVANGSAAQDAGLERGDVLVEADHMPLKTTADLHKALAGRKVGSRLLLRVYRPQEGYMFMPLKLG